VSKRFLIISDPLDADQVKGLKDALSGSGWWHWLPNFWLVIDTEEAWSAVSLRDKIRSLNSDVRCLVMEIKSETWAAMTKRNAKGVQMTDWIESNWDTEDP
jgi:hypothetical protein